MLMITANEGPLSGSEHHGYSQWGEEGVLQALAQQLPLDQSLVDVGAWDGLHLSNSRRLVEQGWSALLIEGDPSRAELAARNSSRFPNVKTHCEFVGGSRTLAELVTESTTWTRVGVLMVDVDGPDLKVWKSLAPVRAQVVVIEYNPSIPLFAHVEQLDQDGRTGNSVRALMEYAQEIGMELVHATPANLFFVDSGLTTGRMEVCKPDEILDDSGCVKGAYVDFSGNVHPLGSTSLTFPWDGALVVPFHYPKRRSIRAQWARMRRRLRSRRRVS